MRIEKLRESRKRKNCNLWEEMRVLRNENFVNWVRVEGIWESVMKSKEKWGERKILKKGNFVIWVRVEICEVIRGE